MSTRDTDQFFMLLLIACLVALLLLGGIALGTSWGRDEVANEWCISLEYDMGEYDNDMNNVVCKYVEIIEGE